MFIQYKTNYVYVWRSSLK